MKRQALLVLVTVVGLYGCASTEELLAKDGAQCDGIGITAGDPLRAQCVLEVAKIRQREEALRWQRAGAIMSGTAAGMSRAQSSAPAPVGVQPQKVACFKASEYASGFNKVCNYNCAGSPYSVTIPNTSFCPFQP